MTGSRPQDHHSGIWRHRRRRLLTGTNVLVAVLLAALLTAMVNGIAARYYTRWDVSRKGYYELSDKSRGLVAGLEGAVRVLVFFQRSHQHYEDVKALLKEYTYAASRNDGLTFDVEFIDPDRDLARVRAVARDYEVDEPNIVVFESAGRRKYVEADAVTEYDTRLEGGVIKRTLKAFAGEQVFSSALHTVMQPVKPVVYFLAGHGERDIDDYSETLGYSGIARVLRRDNLEVRALVPAAEGGLPDDCDLLVIAGPVQQLSQREKDLIAAYLAGHGRVLAMIDPGTDPGLAALFGAWGVRLGREVVVGMTMTGRELVVTNFGEHPVTDNLRNVVAMFYRPRVVEALSLANGDAGAAEDRARVSELASNTAAGWAEADLKQYPPRFDEGVDRRGPVSLAVAVEKGSLSGLDVEIEPTRLVVIGGSAFVSNGALKTGVGGNVDFFMNAVNWLLERETLLAIAARSPGIIEHGLSRGRIQLLFLLTSALVPAAVALVGLVIWWKRRT